MLLTRRLAALVSATTAQPTGGAPLERQVAVQARRLVLDPANRRRVLGRHAHSGEETEAPAERDVDDDLARARRSRPPSYGSVPVGSRTRADEGDRGAARAPPSTTRQRPSSSSGPSPQPWYAFQEKGAPPGRQSLDAKRVADERRPLAVGHVGQPMPGVDETVERAAAAAHSRDAQAQVQIRASRPRRSVRSRIAVSPSSRKRRSSGFSPASSCVHENEFDQSTVVRISKRPAGTVRDESAGSVSRDCASKCPSRISAGPRRRFPPGAGDDGVSLAAAVDAAIRRTAKACFRGSRSWRTGDPGRLYPLARWLAESLLGHSNLRDQLLPSRR